MWKKNSPLWAFFGWLAKCHYHLERIVARGFRLLWLGSTCIPRKWESSLENCWRVVLEACAMDCISLTKTRGNINIVCLQNVFQQASCTCCIQKHLLSHSAPPVGINLPRFWFFHMFCAMFQVEHIFACPRVGSKELRQSSIELLQLWQSRMRVVHFLVGGRMSIVELKIAMVGFRYRYFRPMYSGAADPKGERKLYAKSGKYWTNFYVQGSQSGGVCGLGIVDVELRFVD